MKVILYSNSCPKCNILKNKLDNKNIEYKINNDEKIMIGKGFRSLPMLEIDGNVMNFLDAINWIQEV